MTITLLGTAQNPLSNWEVIWNTAENLKKFTDYNSMCQFLKDKMHVTPTYFLAYVNNMKNSFENRKSLITQNIKAYLQNNKCNLHNLDSVKNVVREQLFLTQVSNILNSPQKADNTEPYLDQETKEAVDAFNKDLDDVYKENRVKTSFSGIKHAFHSQTKLMTGVCLTAALLPLSIAGMLSTDYQTAPCLLALIGFSGLVHIKESSLVEGYYSKINALTERHFANLIGTEQARSLIPEKSLDSHKVDE